MIVRVYSISSSKHDPGIEGALSPREALPQPTFDIDSLLSFISKPGDSSAITSDISHLIAIFCPSNNATASMPYSDIRSCHLCQRSDHQSTSTSYYYWVLMSVDEADLYVCNVSGTNAITGPITEHVTALHNRLNDLHCPLTATMICSRLHHCSRSEVDQHERCHDIAMLDAKYPCINFDRALVTTDWFPDYISACIYQEICSYPTSPLSSWSLLAQNFQLAFGN